MTKYLGPLRSTLLRLVVAGVLAGLIGLLAFDGQPSVSAQSQSSDATLSALTLSNIDFGTFDPETLEYTAQVYHGITQTNATVTRNHPKATYLVKLDGVTDEDGTIPISAGSNVITVEVTAEDGQTMRTYSVTVTRPVSNIAHLIDLTLSGISLEHGSIFYPPGFSGLVFNYTPSVAHSLTETTVTPRAHHSFATYIIKLDGVTDADGVIALSVGSNVITIEVTAEDGESTKTYTITVTRAPAPLADATLKSLLLSGIDIGSGMGVGTIVPTATSYTASVYHSVSQTTVSPTVNHPAASYVIKLGGVEDADGTISLAVGSNVITVEVTAEDDSTTKTYTVTVNRATASAPTTGELSTDDPPVNFRNTAITEDHAIYSFNFPRNRGIFGWVMQRYEHDGDSFVSSGPHMRSEHTGDRDIGGEGFKLGDSNVEPGVLYQWVMMLTDSLGSTVIEKSLTVRSPGTSPDAALSALSLSDVDFGTFASGTTSYTAQVANSVSQTTVTPTVNHPGASYVIKLGGVTDADGVVPLSVGSNVIAIEVTAQDGNTTKTYTVTVTRGAQSPPSPPSPPPPASTDATLSALILSGVDFGTFASGTTSYAAEVANSVTETTVTPTVNHSGATYAIKLDGVTDADGVISLSVGSNVVTVEVTAQDGNTTVTYTVTVARAAESPPVTPAPADPCVEDLGPLTETVTRSGSWASDCPSDSRSGRYARYYSFSLEEETEVTIDLTSSEDTFLVLLEGSGRGGAQEARNDDIVSGNTDSQIVATLSAGSYTIEATTYSVAATGDFDLSITLPDETAGSPGTPSTTDPCVEDLGPLTETVTRSGSWASDCPSDSRSGRYARYYSFSLEEETEVTIDLTSSEDTFLVLLEGSGRGGAEEARNDDIVSGNTNSQIVATLAAGSYTIEATTYAAGVTGNFDLSITLPEGSNGTPSTTDPCVEDLGAVTGTVTRSGSWASDCPSDSRSGRYARYYSFTLDEETEVTIDLTSSEDPFLFLLQGSGRGGAQEAQNDDIVSGNTNSQIVTTLSAGSYTVEATTYNAEVTGDFSLSVSLTQE